MQFRKLKIEDPDLDRKCQEAAEKIVEYRRGAA
jgi:hypothetical protein